MPLQVGARRREQRTGRHWRTVLWSRLLLCYPPRPYVPELLLLHSCLLSDPCLAAIFMYLIVLPAQGRPVRQLSKGARGALSRPVLISRRRSKL